MTENTPAILPESKIQVCLDFCKQQGFSAIVLAIPDPTFDHRRSQALLAQPMISGILLSDSRDAPDSDERIGRIGVYSWHLPGVKTNCIALVGPRTKLSFKMVTQALFKGAGSLVYRSKGGWESEFILRFLVLRLWEWFGSFWGSFWGRLRRKPILANWIFSKNLEKFFEQVPVHRQEVTVDGKVFFFNNSLAWGGAERQLVNTINGLLEKSDLQPSLFCDDLDVEHQHDFFLRHLGEAVRVGLTEDAVDVALDQLGTDEIRRLEAILKLLPQYLADQVFDLTVILMTQKPDIVHAWQDGTNIKVGLAAVLAGVPKIILSMRNMAPIHFKYLTPEMQLTYQKLSRLERVAMLNNSFAGAADYTSWLGLESNRIQVLHNGIDFRHLSVVNNSDRQAMKKSLLIDSGRLVVGSIFRFYEEKDPMLWVDTAIEVARQRSDVEFVIFGIGPMREEAQKRAHKAGIGDLIRMPGTESNTALALSLFDVFLLTSKFEGTPNVLIEAQAFGIPVVSTDSGGSSDTFIDRETGWLCRQRDPQELARYVLASLEDNSWRAGCQAKANPFILDQFGVDRMIDETLAVYEGPG